MLRLWLLTGTSTGYDTYDTILVAAETEEEAKQILPAPTYSWGTSGLTEVWAKSPDKVKAEYIGVAVAGVEAGVILSSFNAG